MIGDNPAGDIKGANEAGWTSILVETGVYRKGAELKGNEIPTYTVEGMKDAVDLIFEKEKLRQ